MKELEHSPERELPSNISIAWGRSTVAFGDVWYHKPNVKNAFLLGIIRDPNGQFDDEEWYALFHKTLTEARKNPSYQYHLSRLDNEFLVPENANNAPFRLVDGKWGDKHMVMFGYKYISRLNI